jgi:hypothetical protein
MLAYKDKYLNFINSIKSNKKICILKLTENYSDIDNNIFNFTQKRLQKKFTFIKSDFFEYYFPNRSLDFCWQCKVDKFENIGGEFQLISLSLFLNNPLETSFKDSVSQDDAVLLKAGYRFFDRPNEYDRAAVKITNGQLEEKVYFINELNKPMKMTLSYPDYMEHVLAIKGLQHWQYLFVDGLQFADVQFGLQRELGNRLEMIKEIFPNDDFSFYQELFKKIK